MDPMTPIPIPAQAPAQALRVDVAGGSLEAWDTGGPGPTVVFMHPATGSARMWLYQQPAFVAAGLRCIGWSRRGHGASSPVDPQAPGSASLDLKAVLDALDLDRVHLVACAAGGV